MDVSSSYDLTTKGLDYKLKVEIASDKIVKQYDSKVKKISSTYNLPGFRKGMVPLNLIKKRYGESIFQDIVGNLADNFKEYWGGLVGEHLPANCKLWGERDDVEKFYSNATPQIIDQILLGVYKCMAWTKEDQASVAEQFQE